MSLVHLTLAFEREGDVWTGTCLELGTSAYADSLDEAEDELAEAIVLQLNEVTRLGFIEQFLGQHGVRLGVF